MKIKDFKNILNSLNEEAELSFVINERNDNYHIEDKNIGFNFIDMETKMLTSPKEADEIEISILLDDNCFIDQDEE